MKGTLPASLHKPSTIHLKNLVGFDVHVGWCSSNEHCILSKVSQTPCFLPLEEEKVFRINFSAREKKKKTIY